MAADEFEDLGIYRLQIRNSGSTGSSASINPVTQAESLLRARPQVENLRQERYQLYVKPKYKIVAEVYLQRLFIIYTPKESFPNLHIPTFSNLHISNLQISTSAHSPISTLTNLLKAQIRMKHLRHVNAFWRLVVFKYSCYNTRQSQCAAI